jgi:alpha-ribazole phosphatase
MQLYLIRHPEPLGHRGLCYGRKDVEVAPATITAAAESIRAQIPDRLLAGAAVLTSPLLRCRTLASALAAPRDPSIAEELLEMNFGTWEGRPWDEVPRAELDAWARDLWDYRPGGGESAAMVAQRWQRWSERVRSTASPVIAVTHGGFIRVALACARRSSAEEFARGSVPFGSVHRLDLDPRAMAMRAAS